MTPLDAVYRFQIATPLSEEQAKYLREIPGTKVFNRTHDDSGRPIRSPLGCEVPYNAGWIVEALYKEWAVPFVVQPPSITWGVFDRQVLFRHGLREAIDPRDGREPIDPFAWARPFQLEVIQERIGTNGGHVWVSPGGGKTFIAILWWLAFHAPAVVVTSSKGRLQWLEEVERFTSRKAHAILPESDRRPGEQNLGDYLKECEETRVPPLVIVGWDGLNEIMEWARMVTGFDGSRAVIERLPTFKVLLEAVRPYSVIFDESHQGKQGKRKQWTVREDGSLEGHDLQHRSSAAYALACASTRRLATTATFLGHLLGTDAYGQLTLVEPNAWSGGAGRFRKHHCGATETGWNGTLVDGDEGTRLEELRKRMAFTVSHVPYSVSHGHLPPKDRQFIKVPVSRQTRPLALVDEDGNKIDGKRLAKMALRETGEERQGAISAYHWMRLAEAASRKRGAAMDEIAEGLLMSNGRGKVILFTGLRSDCEWYKEEIPKKFDGISVFGGHGGTSFRDRHDIQRAYMTHPGPAVLWGTYQAWGESLNLDDTDMMIPVMLPYQPWILEQMEGRSHRLSMTRRIHYRYLWAENTKDVEIKPILAARIRTMDRIMLGGHSIVGIEDELSGRKGREERMENWLIEMNEHAGANDDAELDD